MSAAPRLPRLVAAAITVLTCSIARANSATVPDNFSSIQAAIDFGADTIFVREGSYAEAPQAFRPITLRGLGTERPVLAGLAISNPDQWPSKRWSISDLNIAGRVTITTAWPGPRGLTIEIARCTLDSGFVHHSDDPDDLDIFGLVDCFVGNASYARAGVVYMHRDTLRAGVTLDAAESLEVSNCWFRGGEGVALDINGDYLPGQVQDCVFENYATAIRLSDVVDFVVASNVIRHMSSAGFICASGEYYQFRNNLLSDCHVGVATRSDGLYCRDNTLMRMDGIGLLVSYAESLRVERNIVAACGASAIAVRGGSYSKRLQFYENTLYGNSGSGIDLEPLIGEGDSIWVQGNIVSRNSGWGLRPKNPQEVILLGCNDWYDNGLGAVEGMTTVVSDLSVDPLFCDIANDDVHLYSDSPLLGQPRCAQIGARGVGCRPPALKALTVSSSRVGLGVKWEFVAASAVECWIERADRAAGPWDSLGTGTPMGSNAFELMDAAVAPDRDYYYRVAWKDRGTTVRGGAEAGTWTVEGGLSAISPNPAHGGVQVDWILAKQGFTDIQVFDLVGREVAVVARGSFSLGRHRARWDGQWAGHGVAPAGMYIVRITTSDRAASHRVLLFR